MENPIKMDDLGVPIFGNIHIKEQKRSCWGDDKSTWAQAKAENSGKLGYIKLI